VRFWLDYLEDVKARNLGYVSGIKFTPDLTHRVIRILYLLGFGGSGVQIGDCRSLILNTPSIRSILVSPGVKGVHSLAVHLDMRPLSCSSSWLLIS
jgi:hypothetical protein